MKPGSLWGLSKMIKKLQKDYHDQEINQMFKPVLAREQRKKMEKIKCYPRRNGRDYSWQGDLAIFPQRKEKMYLLLFIDCFSRRLFYKVVTGKSSKVLLPAAQQLLTHFNPKRITFDQESAIMSNEFKDWLQAHDITMYNTVKGQPSGFKGRTMLVERAIRTIKGQVFKHQRAFGGHWNKYIKQIIESYNNSFHRSIRTTPMEAYRSQQTFEDKTKHIKQLALGTNVRILLDRTIFEKGTKHKWSKQIYRIWRYIGKKYKVSSSVGGVHKGVFGRQHLMVVDKVVKGGKRDLRGKHFTLSHGGKGKRYHVGHKPVPKVKDLDYVPEPEPEPEPMPVPKPEKRKKARRVLKKVQDVDSGDEWTPG